MDELIRYVLRELSYDGDLGCDVSRLQEFIQGFHIGNGPVASQKVDDAYCSFVWATIVQQPNVRVGKVPEGTGPRTEVYIAPQNSVKKKADAKGEDVAEVAPVTLEVVPDAGVRPLEDLKQEYGDKLRIAVDPDTIFLALTGSHIRDSKLSPMVYTALQLISRGREAGISSIDLAKKSGYDAKTCHYLVNKLMLLDFVVKRSKNGVSTSTIVHKDLFKRDATWQSIVDEETRAREAQKRTEQDEGSDEEDGQDNSEYSGSIVKFTAIDERHLSSLDLIRGRLETLLKNSPHGLHTANNLLPRLGFANPKKSNRRYFVTRCLNELVRQGVIEKVKVPGRRDGLVICIRMVEGSRSDISLEDSFQQQNDAFEADADDEEQLAVNLTLHRQIINALDESAETGMTQADLCKALGNFDRRTIELLLGRLHTHPPPPHLGDIGIAHVVESHGRERRYRYWTVAHYLAMVAKENFTGHSYQDVDLAKTGGFMALSNDQFYENEDSLNAYVDDYKGGHFSGTTETGKSKKSNKAGRADGVVKRGRPRKNTSLAERDAGTTSKVTGARGQKRKRGSVVVDEAQAQESPPKRKRGRPLKQRPVAGDEGRLDDANLPADRTIVMTVTASPKTVDNPPVRKCGRPLKVNPADAEANRYNATTPARAIPRKRARPRRNLLPDSSNGGVEDFESSGTGETVAPLSIPPTNGDTSSHTTLPSVPSEPPFVTQPQTSTTPPAIDVNLPTGEESVASVERWAESAHTVSKLRQSTLVEIPSTGFAEATMDATNATAHASDPLNPVDAQVLHHVRADSSQTPIDPTLLAPSGAASVADASSASCRFSDATETATGGVDNFVAKRMQNADETQERPEKRTYSGKQVDGLDRANYHKTRLIQARRERELLRVITEAGGVVNVSSKDFYEAHVALVEAMSKAGEATSTRVGSRMDKRTAETTLRNLEAQAKVRLITTTVRTATGASRLVRIVYLPEITEVQLNTFLSDISILQFPPAPPMKTLEEPITYGGHKYRRSPVLHSSSASAGHLSVDHATTSQRVQHGDEPIREMVASDRNAVAQSYGFLTGKIARARVLHRWITEFLQSGVRSSNIVSGEERIFSFSLFFTDLPISTYCAVVSSQVQNDALHQLLHSPGGPLTAIKQVSPTIHEALQIGRWRSRDRLLDIMEVLCRLHLVEPIVPSDSVAPALSCEPVPDHPSSFDVTLVEAWTPPTAPIYFRLASVAPVHLWAVSEDSPPFWKNIPVYPTLQCDEFWHTLQTVCQVKDVVKQIPDEEIGSPLGGVGELGRVLRRPTSWNDHYVLSHQQEESLKQYVDVSNGDTPLQHPHSEDRTAEISATLFAPRDVVNRFFDNMRNKILSEKEKIEKKAQRKVEEAKAREARSKAMIAQRAADARVQRERDWDGMVFRIHPDSLADSADARIRRVRARFLQSSGKNHAKWEGEIAQAIQESIIASKKLLPTNRPTFSGPDTLPVPLPPVVSTSPDRPIAEIVASQGPRLQPRKPSKKSKKGKEVEREDSPAGSARRQRFQWNRELDELARDASAIIKARCRGHHRIDLSALDQVFPAVPRNSVRQRIAHLRLPPGADAYLQRLEDKWYDIWVQHRGTDALPDDNPDSPSDFDVVVHLGILRKHIDKNALRVGFVESRSDTSIVLPTDVGLLESLWDVREKSLVSPVFDFVWSGAAEEGREKLLAQVAFTTDIQDMPPAASCPSDGIYVAESAMKMVLGTPNETYDIHAATALLQSVGEGPIKMATENMLARGVISKIVRDPSKGRPGRTLKISDSNQGAIGGSVPLDVFQDAVVLEDVLSQDGEVDAWREWSLLSSDGDVAGLLELVSKNKIDFVVDTSNTQVKRPAFDWNSKKADDDDIETAIMTRISEQSESAPSSPSLEPGIDTLSEHSGNTPQKFITPVPADPVLFGGTVGSDQPGNNQHGKGSDGGTAFCRQSSNNLVDCQACLQQASLGLLRSTVPGETEVLSSILGKLHSASMEGLTKARIMISHPAPRDFALVALKKITDAAVPLAYWTGYRSAVLVAAEYIRPYTVCISDGTKAKAMILPRRWLDIYGKRIKDVWEAALRAVIGVILMRPGVSQAEVRWRLRSVYDRQEVHYVLQHLYAQGYLNRRIADAANPGIEVGLPDHKEEKHMFWFLNEEKYWYGL